MILIFNILHFRFVVVGILFFTTGAFIFCFFVYFLILGVALFV